MAVCALDLWIARECPPRQGEPLPDAVARHQLEWLNSALTRAAKSRFYRGRLPRSVPSLHALGELPYTTSEALRNWGALLCVSQSEVARMVSLHTSGTTGIPKRLAFTENDLARTREFFSVGMGQMVRHGDTVAVLFPGADRPSGVADVLRQALPEVRVVSGSVDAGGKICAGALCGKVRPQVLVLLPTQLEVLLAHGPWPELRSVLTSGEVLRDSLRQRSLDALPGRLVLDHYGLTEICFGGGVECPAHSGYHLREADLLVEIVDDRGVPVQPGEAGEIVITTLRHEAMPLIRYRTGDMSRILSGPCACGSPLQRLERVYGRRGFGENVLALPKGYISRSAPLALSAGIH